MEIWTSSNLVKVYTKNGYVLKLKGLGNELDKIELDKDHPIINRNFSNLEKTYTSFYTFNNPKLFRLPVKTKFNYIKDEKLLVVGRTLNTKLYEEVSLRNLISWKFRNLFWVDAEGNVIKSRQSFTPKNPEITILLTKKYKKPE